MLATCFDMSYHKYKCLIEKECEKILCNYSVYDVLTFLDDYIYDLSDTVNNNYFLALSVLEEHYMNIYKEGLIN